MPSFEVHLRVTHAEYYVTRIETDSVAQARARALDQDNHRDRMQGAEHVATEVEAVKDADSGKELWNESDDADSMLDFQSWNAALRAHA
jgi:hypothetical protein